MKSLPLATLLIATLLTGVAPAASERSLTATATAPATASAPAASQRWAVIIGINAYRQFATGLPDATLRGAINDANGVSRVLTGHFGFPSSNVMLLLDGAATKAAIRAALTVWLRGRVKAGDQVVFFFSGHGSQIPDVNGDESDGLDETLAPADVLSDGASNDITDDELHAWLGTLPTTQVTVILDSCHSGSASRALGDLRTKALPRRRPPPRPRPSGTVRPRRDDDPWPSGYVEIAAAASDENAADAAFRNEEGGPVTYGGVFTTFLLRELWTSAPGETFAAVMQEVRSRVQTAGYPQRPQLLGDSAKTVFDVREVAVLSPPRITRVDGATAVVNAGRNRKLARNSVLETSSGAQLRIDVVEEGESSARILSGRPIVGDAVSLVAQAFPEPRFELVVDARLRPLASSLTDSLRQFIRIDVVAGSSTADAALVAVRDSVRLVGREGAVRYATRASTAARDTSLRRALESMLATKVLAGLDAPAGAPGVTLEHPTHRRSFAIGDTIAFKVTSTRAGYLTLIDLAPDGVVTVLTPSTYFRVGQLTANVAVIIPGPEDGVVLRITPPAGRGIVRAVVSDTPVPVGPSAGEQDSGVQAAKRVLQSLRQAASRGITVERVERSQQMVWGSALYVYDVGITSRP